MHPASNIARRYLFSRKSHHLINVVSWVSLAGVAVGTFGLIVVLSVFNGFGNLVLSLYDSFDPDIRIVSAEGKTFESSEKLLNNIKACPLVAELTPVLETMALVRYRDRQMVVTLKGVDTSFLKTTGIAGKIIAGEAVLQEGDRDFLIVGSHIAYKLGLRPEDPLYRISIFLPRSGIDLSAPSLEAADAFSEKAVYASGVFGVQQDFDARYIITPLRLVHELKSVSDRQHSQIEIKLKDGTDPSAAREALQAICGDGFIVKDRLMQHDFLYKILHAEKAAVYLILGFILIIAAFNLFGTLTMLILDKKKDLQTLFSMGADLSLVRRIFLLEGMMISVGGSVAGLFCGALVCGIQQYFGIIRLGEGESYITEAYPVDMQWGDFLIVIFTALLIGYIAARYTSGVIVTRLADDRLKQK